MHKHLLILTAAAALTLQSTAAFAADAPDPTARRVAVKFDAAVGCSSARDRFPLLKAAYYSDLEEVSKHASAIVNGCAPMIKDGEAVVLMFFIKPTVAAEKPTLVHLPIEKNAEFAKPLHDLLGRTTIHWIYVTDDDCDEMPVVELSVTKTVDPTLASIGALAKTLIPVLPLTVPGGAAHTLEAITPAIPVVPPVPPCSQQPPSGERVHLAVGTADVPYDRGTVSESVYLRRILRDDDGSWLKADGKTAAPLAKDAGWVQLEGSTAFSSTPRSFVTFHAGAAVLVGNVSGARQMKIDSDKFVSDPLNKVATLAGVSWHLPFDGTEATPSAREHLGIFTGAILTPAPGIAFGGVYGWRGFGLFVGWGQMWVKTAPNDLVEGAAVPAGSTLVFKPTHGLLVGATYAFGS